MSAPAAVIRGVVRGGVVVFDPPAAIPDGTEVQITVPILEFTPEERAEFEAWEKLSDEAWRMIEGWENESGIAVEGTASPEGASVNSPGPEPREHGNE